MSDRSDEVTESKDPDDLLEETDRLLSETGVDTGDELSESAGPAPSVSDADPESATDFDHDGDGGPGSTAVSDDGSSRSWLPSGLPAVPSRLSPGRYFSPKEYLALVLLLSASFLAGATVSPVGGRLIGMIGMFIAAFAVGLVASKRRYLEMTVAGGSVGGVAAILNYAVIAAVGSGERLVAVGAAIGLLASVVGYYFGRDLRDGLSKDVD